MTSPFSVIGYWVSAAAAIWAGCAALAFGPMPAVLYGRVYGAHMGHHVAAQLNRASRTGQPVCLLVGLSTTRTDLVPSIFESEMPGLAFIEVASAGGSIFGVELLVDMIREHRIRPACIVLGLHSHLLKDRTLALWPAGFLDVITPVQQARFIPLEVPGERTRTLIEAARRALWPAFRASEQLSAVWRDALFRSQGLLVWREPKPRSAFERATGELAPFDEANPPLERAMNAEQQERFWVDMNRQRLLDPDTYARPDHVASLIRLISDSLRLAPVVVVDVLPESREARERVSPLADGPFYTALDQLKSPRLHVLDDRAAVADDQFDAAFHLLHDGAEDYSRRLARQLAPFLTAR